jgi:hypothetical protein
MPADNERSRCATLIFLKISPFFFQIAFKQSFYRKIIFRSMILNTASDRNYSAEPSYQCVPDTSFSELILLYLA